MANQVTNYKCPSCLASLHFAANSGKMECEYCGSSFSVEEIEAKYKAENEKAAAAKLENDNKKVDADFQEVNDQLHGAGMKIYKCSSCGGELVCDENTAASSCPYCSCPTIIPGQFNGMLKPDYIIPFKYERKQALDILKKHYGDRFFLPSSFKNTNHLEEVKGIYVPFWLYDGNTNGFCSYEATKTHVERDGNEEITTTEYYSLERSGGLAFEKIPADGSKNMPDDLMDSIEPYTYDELKPFTIAYLSGYFADKYDVDTEEDKKRAIDRAVGSTRSLLRNDITGNYDLVRETSNNINVNINKTSYALMPVWLLNTKWNGQNFKFAMNGQTGKIVGDLPLDKTKFSLVIMATFILVSWGCNAMGGVELLFSIIIGFVVTLITGLVIANSMKSVALASSADNYVIPESAIITSRQDVYVRSSVSRRIIEEKKD